MSDNLYRAIRAEHVQRTGHNPDEPIGQRAGLVCEVCLYLAAEQRLIREAEMRDELIREFATHPAAKTGD